VRHSIVDIKYDFYRLTLSVDAFDGINKLLSLPGEGVGLAFRRLVADVR
jgi:hypothetical protein